MGRGGYKPSSGGVSPKGSVTSNSATYWGPTVQTHEPVGCISHSNPGQGQHGGCTGPDQSGWSLRCGVAGVHLSKSGSLATRLDVSQLIAPKCSPLVTDFTPPYLMTPPKQCHQTGDQAFKHVSQMGR